MPDPADDAVDSYWRRLRTDADEWLRTAAPDEHAVTFAGLDVRLRFAGPALAPVVLPALAHLLAVPSAQAADLTVLLADRASTGGEPPPIPWPIVAGEAWTLSTSRFSALHLPALGSVLWLDRAERVALYWVPDASAVPLAERGSPLLTLWAWWLADHGLQLTHAAAVGADGPASRGAALIVGPGGSGKSTTALTCIGSPLRYLADDYCVVDPSDEPSVHCLYSTGKVASEDDERFESLHLHRVGRDAEKTLYCFHPAGAGLLARTLPLRAIVVPAITGRPETTSRPISAMDALRAVAPSTLLQLRTGLDPSGALKRLAAVARRVPCHRLELGTALERIPQALEALLG